MNDDFERSAAFAEAAEMYRDWYCDPAGALSDIRELAISACGKRLAFLAVRMDSLIGRPDSGLLMEMSLESGAVRQITPHPCTVTSLAWSPVEASLALIDQAQDECRILVLSMSGQLAEEVTRLRCDGARQLSWSPDGSRLLIVVSGTDADEAGADGGRSALASKPAQDWKPEVRTSDQRVGVRSLKVVDLASRDWLDVPDFQPSVWEAAWSGSSAVALIASEAPGEEQWYSSCLYLLDLVSGAVRLLYKPLVQIGSLAACPAGDKIAFVEAICSDRRVVCGTLNLVDTRSGTCRAIDTQGYEASDLHFDSGGAVVLAAHRAQSSAVLFYEPDSASFEVIWEGREAAISGAHHAQIASGSSRSSVVFVREGWFDAPRLCWIHEGRALEVRGLVSPALEDLIASEGEATQVVWRCAQDPQVMGWVLMPREGAKPFALVTEIHGGPVAQSRPRYLGRTPLFRQLLRQGFAVFFPNPSGSTGRGQDFVHRVVGDMGGRDAAEILAGIDALVEQGLADPERLGLTGGSYGGFMTCLLIGQTNRFAAAVAVCPVTDWVSERLTSNLATFCDLFLQADIKEIDGPYTRRSPVYFAASVETPVLLVCGALDASTPPGQSEEYFNAIRLNGGTAALVTYPQEGHRPRSFPALIDYSARITSWFHSFLAQDIGSA